MNSFLPLVQEGVYDCKTRLPDWLPTVQGVANELPVSLSPPHGFKGIGIP